MSTALTPAPSRFEETLDGLAIQLNRGPVRTLQLNVGKLCNQACSHCHVDAGPKRPEIMGREVAQKLAHLIEHSEALRTVDFTGGAPELNPHFRGLVEVAAKRGRQILDRCNLSVLLEPGQEDLAQFLADKRAKVVASLPCYSAKNVDRQRGKGVFDKSIIALRRLNALGYGQPGSGLVLDLVYNPFGPSLPPSQATLEVDYKRELHQQFGIVFSRLITITNMPIARFRKTLVNLGRLDEYQQLLIDAFNPRTLDGLMCRDQVSVGWQGELYDCDFNQMLELGVIPTSNPVKTTIFDLETLDELEGGPIALANHCFGCTAGCGSSCSGAID